VPQRRTRPPGGILRAHELAETRRKLARARTIVIGSTKGIRHNAWGYACRVYYTTRVSLKTIDIVISMRRQYWIGCGKGEGVPSEKAVAFILLFLQYRNMKKADPALVTRSALRFSALGAEPRCVPAPGCWLRIQKGWSRAGG